MLRSIAVAAVLQRVGLLRRGPVEAILRWGLCIRSHGDHSVAKRYEWGYFRKQNTGKLDVDEKNGRYRGICPRSDGFVWRDSTKRLRHAQAVVMSIEADPWPVCLVLLDFVCVPWKSKTASCGQRKTPKATCDCR